MTQSESFIDSLFFRLSYTFKLKLVLFVGFSPCVVILILAYFLQLQPIGFLIEQTNGLSYLGTLTEAVDNILKESSMKSESAAEELRIKIDQQFMSLRKNDQQWSSSGLYEPLSSKIDLLIAFWKETEPKQKKLSEEEALRGILNSYSELLPILSRVSSLNLSEDASTAYILSALVRKLPQAISTTSQQLNSNDPYPPVFFETLDLLYNNLTLGFESNPSFSLDPWNADTSQAISHLRELASKLRGEHTFEQSINAASAMLGLQQALNKQLQMVINKQIKTIEWYHFWTINWIFLGGGLVIVIYLMRITRRPLQNLKKASEALAAGYLNIRVPITTHDEVAEMTVAFNHAAQFFETILYDAVKIVRLLTKASEQIIHNSNHMESNLSMQEETVKDLTFAVRSFTKEMQDFAGDLEHYSKTAAAAGSFAGKGSENLREMESIMQQMQAGSSNIVTTLSTLQERVLTIKGLIKSIVKIADQSNLLSLNTAIRANKTGTQGRGFVIIADRIREMADHIAYATLDIEKVVQEIVDSVVNAGGEVSIFSNQIHNKVEETKIISSSLNKLIDDTRKQFSSFTEIQKNVLKQLEGIIEISGSLEELKERAQTSANAARRLQTEMEYLNEASMNLEELTGRFQFTDEKR